MLHLTVLFLRVTEAGWCGLLSVTAFLFLLLLLLLRIFLFSSPLSALSHLLSPACPHTSPACLFSTSPFILSCSSCSSSSSSPPPLYFVLLSQLLSCGLHWLFGVTCFLNRFLLFVFLLFQQRATVWLGKEICSWCSKASVIDGCRRSVNQYIIYQGWAHENVDWHLKQLAKSKLGVSSFTVNIQTAYQLTSWCISCMCVYISEILCHQRASSMSNGPIRLTMNPLSGIRKLIDVRSIKGKLDYE